MEPQLCDAKTQPYWSLSHGFYSDIWTGGWLSEKQLEQRGLFFLWDCKLWVQKDIYSANQKVTLLTISYDNVDNERIVNL